MCFLNPFWFVFGFASFLVTRVHALSDVGQSNVVRLAALHLVCNIIQLQVIGRGLRGYGALLVTKWVCVLTGRDKKRQSI